MNSNSEGVDEYGEEVVGGDNQMRNTGDNDRRAAGA